LSGRRVTCAQSLLNVLITRPSAARQIILGFQIGPPSPLRGMLRTSSLLIGALVIVNGGEIFGLYPLARPAGYWRVTRATPSGTIIVSRDSGSDRAELLEIISQLP
jgi:hypothetical protein